MRKQVAALLAAEIGSLPAHDIAAEATWANKFRDAYTDGPRDKAK